MEGCAPFRISDHQDVTVYGYTCLRWPSSHTDLDLFGPGCLHSIDPGLVVDQQDHHKQEITLQRAEVSRSIKKRQFHGVLQVMVIL
jgi:hypothetical protein